MSTKTEVTKSGITFGAALAIAISWSVNKHNHALHTELSLPGLVPI